MRDDDFESLGSTLLVQVELTQEQLQDDIGELRRLAESGGGKVRGSICCKRDAPDPSLFVGSGKAEEIASLVLAEEVETVIFNNKLSPAQERNLEKILKVRVMDRVALILLIFAQRARTYEGKLQVELARLQYEQARLVRGWTHLERQKGGFGLRGGPGETQIELDRRALKERIGSLKKELEIVAKRREQNRSRRVKNSVPVVSFVGYTNAGKSTLFNKITNSSVYAADQLFATLDPTLRTVELPSVGKCVFADTVGFIRNLPHDLIAAFRGTLEETSRADLLLHVVDAADPKKDVHIEAVNAVLKQVGAERVKTLLVFNKADLTEDNAYGIVRDGGIPVRVCTSALTGRGINDLLQAAAELLGGSVCSFELRLGNTDGRVRSLLYAAKAVDSERIDDVGESILEIKIKAEDAARIDKKSGGALSKAFANKSLPWAANNEFDFNSVE